jgi:hypothetical protein
VTGARHPTTTRKHTEPLSLLSIPQTSHLPSDVDMELASHQSLIPCVNMPKMGGAKLRNIRREHAPPPPSPSPTPHIVPASKCGLPNAVDASGNNDVKDARPGWCSEAMPRGEYIGDIAWVHKGTMAEPES